jgi:hypothetical protein
MNYTFTAFSLQGMPPAGRARACYDTSVKLSMMVDYDVYMLYLWYA